MAKYELQSARKTVIAADILDMDEFQRDQDDLEATYCRGRTERGRWGDVLTGDDISMLVAIQEAVGSPGLQALINRATNPRV